MMKMHVLLQVGITIPSIKATVSDREYRLITSVAGQNFGEELRLPDAALWLEEAYRPEAFEDAEPERASSGQVRSCQRTPQSSQLSLVSLLEVTILLKRNAPSCDEAKPALHKEGRDISVAHVKRVDRPECGLMKVNAGNAA